MDCERDKDGEYRDMLGECHFTELRERNFCRGGNQNYSCKHDDEEEALCHHGGEEVECLCQFQFL